MSTNYPLTFTSQFCAVGWFHPLRPIAAQFTSQFWPEIAIPRKSSHCCSLLPPTLTWLFWPGVYHQNSSHCIFSPPDQTTPDSYISLPPQKNCPTPLWKQNGRTLGRKIDLAYSFVVEHGLFMGQVLNWGRVHFCLLTFSCSTIW